MARPCAAARRHAGARKAALIATLAAVWGSTPAQAASFSDFSRSFDNMIGDALELVPRGLHDVRIGLGPSLAPDFLGDSHVSVSPAPVVSLRYRNIVTIDNNSIRLNFLGTNIAGRNSPWSAGPAVRLDFGRDESDSPKLRGLGDIGTAVELGAYVGYTTEQMRYRLRVRKDVAGAHGGWLVDADATNSRIINDRLFLDTSVHVTWGDAAYTGAFFGITPEQSLRSGLPVYRAHAGLHDISLSVTGEYLLTERWPALATAGFTRLFGSASGSPLVKQRGSPNNPNLAVFAIYAF